MSFVKNARIRTKVLMVIVPLCVVGLGATAFMAVRYKAADEAYSYFISNDMATSLELVELQRDLSALAYGASQTLIYDKETPAQEKAMGLYNEKKTSLQDRFVRLKESIPEKAKELGALFSRAGAILATTDLAIQYRADGDATASTMLAEADTQIMRLSRDVTGLSNLHQQQLLAKNKALNEEATSTITSSLVGSAIAFAIGIIAAVLLATQGITAPIIRLRERMLSLAAGDTQKPVTGQDRRDELGRMAAAVETFRMNAIERVRLEHDAEEARENTQRDHSERENKKAAEAADLQSAVTHLETALQHLAGGNVTYRINDPFVAHLDSLRVNFNRSANTLRDLLVDVGANANGIDAGSNEIRVAADDLSRRTEQQAASVEETAAALEQIATTVHDASDRATEVGNLVEQARKEAEASSGVVREAVAAMNEIERSSHEITNIISVIDEIAFQTNLLALNAGVEAARAGEAGKGFAVVAQEVRELAQRSARAANEIKGLINTSGGHVRTGVGLVDATGKALHEIVERVQEISLNITMIVESSREQSVGLQEITRAVNVIDQNTQQNAAMVEETTAASHALACDAAALNELLSRFQFQGPRDEQYRTPVTLVA
ncbi:methyl-accepting chemotaxis protein [Agrobacterium rubi]|uniref:Methyl-accepting chemotaxis protein n=1 Tax=Agrobacterium rubi TaxID=28099 RepID=A0ABX2JAQ8_9HYPH|nr:methyl-accepting chemotaxis protein [Agrobacterium rubi]NTF39473.1 methyl-accepting chemotaxis protein [Agrobacterium rubi]